MPKTYSKWVESGEQLKPLEEVSIRFHKQYLSIILHGDDRQLQERLKKGAAYFEEQLLFIRILLKNTLLNSDNKNIRKRRDELLSSMNTNYKLKFQLLHYVSQNGFQLQDYLKTKARLSISL